ncbi:MAG TPA: ATP-binding protein [Candidatus Marinimicrobia bacterium]|nr:ATP-binding protein [Candidatus Neomarinimicrobiota bacterium]
MANLIEIKISNKIPEIEHVCEEITRFSRQYAVPDKDIFTLHLAIDEILTNIISYGYSDKDEHYIEIRYTLEKDYLKLEIIDDSNPFDPADAPEPDVDSNLADRKIGGLGIYLIKNMMDEINYSSKNGKNTLVLTKKCKHK